MADGLLDTAAVTSDRRRLITPFVDAGALVPLSLVPLRNRETVLHRGRHIEIVGDDDPADFPRGWPEMKTDVCCNDRSGRDRRRHGVTE